jgi:hypothetical protein
MRTVPNRKKGGGKSGASRTIRNTGSAEMAGKKPKTKKTKNQKPEYSNVISPRTREFKELGVFVYRCEMLDSQ